MSVCPSCGHERDPATVGRFCTNCGHPVGAPVEGSDWRGSTAERPAVGGPPAAGPPAPGPPPGGPLPGPPPPVHTAPLDPPRYPLYADEVGSPGSAGPGAATAPLFPGAAGPGVPPDDLGEDTTGQPAHRRTSWWPWALVAAVLTVVALFGVKLMFGGGDDPEPAAATATTERSQEPPTRETSTTPSPTPTKETSSSAPGEPVDVASGAVAEVPATAPPNQDVNGNTVTYDAANMLDGLPETCWRMPGDGSGEAIVYTLAEETELTSVGLINGYAKTAGTLDWYTGNRRVVAVAWEFDDGSVVTQELDETRDLQVLEIDPVTTRTVRLTLIEVSEPGTGPSSRDYTAISEASFVGTPA